jgi:hypothetical protein
LTEGALRSAGGAITNSSADYVIALAETSGGHPSYLFDGGRKATHHIDEEAVGIFRDETGSAIKITIAFIYTSERDR